MHIQKTAFCRQAPKKIDGMSRIGPEYVGQHKPKFKGTKLYQKDKLSGVGVDFHLDVESSQQISTDSRLFQTAQYRGNIVHSLQE